LCYHNIESCVLNNGWASNYFNPERGVRQGCPLRLIYFFILCAEILASKIRKNKNIKGITVCGNEIKISQYADDTTMIIVGSKKSFTSALLDLRYLACDFTTEKLKFSGLGLALDVKIRYVRKKI